MNILSNLQYQTRQIQTLMESDIDKQSSINHYYFLETDCNFLDIAELEIYITENKINNTIVLEAICYNCIQVINLWNKKNSLLPDAKFDECFSYKDSEKGIRFSMWLKFHFIALKNNKFIFFETDYQKRTFLKNYYGSIKSYILQDIIIICNNILNLITASFPNVTKAMDKRKKVKLKDFIKDNKAEALALNLSDYPAINQVLQKQKCKIEDAEFESEIKEVKVFAEKAIKDLKHNLQTYLKNGNEKTNYINHTPPYLWDIRLLLEYRELLNLEQPIKPHQSKNIEIKAKRELHNNIFKDNAFDVWQSMFEQFKIKESSYSTDLDFMYNVMYNDQLIHKEIGKVNMVDWINDIYKITFTKIRFNNPKSDANKNRLNIYNQILGK